MVLYVVGLGLGGEKDITVRGLDAVRGSAKVVLEHYAPIVGVDKAKLAAFYGKDVVLADRNLESAVDSMCATAKDEDVSFLVAKDPFRPNTMSYTELFVQARELGVQVEVIHNVSDMDAVGPCGLKGSNFGQIVSLRLGNGNREPDESGDSAEVDESGGADNDFYDKIRANRENGLHTLCDLDIKVDSSKEVLQSEESSPPVQYMSVGTALQQLLEMEQRKGLGAYGPDTHCVGLARLGKPTQQIVVGTMSELLDVDFGEPLYYLVICGKVDEDERKLLEFFRVARDRTDEQSSADEDVADPASTETAEPDLGDSGLLTCPRFHGLSLFNAPNALKCDVCGGSIPENSHAFGCRRCDYDVCNDCRMGSYGAFAVVEPSAEDAAFNRAVVAEAVRRSQQQREAATVRMTQQYHQMSLAASAQRYSYQSCSCRCSCSKCMSSRDRLALAASASSASPSWGCSCRCSCSKCM